jgi:hypothetical protein
MEAGIPWQAFDQLVPMELTVPSIDSAVWRSGTSQAFSSDQQVLIQEISINSILEREKEQRIVAQLHAAALTMDTFDREQIAAQLAAAAPCHYED